MLPHMTTTEQGTKWERCCSEKNRTTQLLSHPTTMSLRGNAFSRHPVLLAGQCEVELRNGNVLLALVKFRCLALNDIKSAKEQVTT